MGARQEALWDEDPPYRNRGAVRRALDRSITEAKKSGTEFLEVELAALRRQANDLDRMERLVSAPGAKTWDYTPKTQAHAAFSEAVARVFGRDSGDGDDEFSRALADFEAAEAAARAQAGDPARSQPTD